MRRWLRKHLPDRNQFIKDHSYLGKFKDYLIKQDIWRLNRHSVACGVAAGLFAAFIPLPIQTLIAAFLAILLRGNILIAAAMTWVSNPITFAPIVYIIYATGDWILGIKNKHISIPVESIKFNNLYDLSSVELISHFSKAYLIGFPIVAISAALLGYVIVVYIWKTSAFLHNLRKKKSNGGSR